MTWKRTSPLARDEMDGSDIEDDDNGAPFEDTELPLPSNLPNAAPALFPDLSRIEELLRVGQAYDTLKQLRKALALRLAMQRESRNSCGQRENLRSKAALRHADSDINLIVARYNAAHSALSRLNIIAEYPDLRVLTPKDLTIANVFEPHRPLGRGYDTTRVSWIWRMKGIATELHDDNWLREGEYRNHMATSITDRGSSLAHSVP